MWGHQFPLLLYALIYSVKSQTFTIGEQQELQTDVAAGGQILLSLGSVWNVRSGSWRFNCLDVALWIGNSTDVSNDYWGRAELSENGSLSLKSLSLNDSGEYVVTVNPLFSNESIISRIQLKVLEPVSKPGIVPSVSQILEYNGTVTLNCNVSGDSPSTRWIKDGHYLQYNDRMNLSWDNHTLTITAVNRSDSGEYQCEAHNSVSNKTSDALYLMVYYGPEEPQISIDPDQQDITLGSNVTFTCSVQSVPPPEFEWFFNGRPLLQKGQAMTIFNMAGNNAGNYMCQAYNNVTGKYINVTATVNVLEPVSKPNISADVLNPIEHSDTVTLICSVTGDVRLIYWIKTNQFIQNNERIKLSADNVTMTIASVNRSDSGNYTCQAWGHLNNQTSDPFSLSICYGPDTPQLTIVDEEEAYVPGSNLTLWCYADSVPPAAFEWLLDGRSLQWSNQQLVLFHIAKSDFGNYTCRAHNNHTNKYAEATKQITAVGISKPKITANNSHPIEHNDTVTLSCDVSGHLHSLIWRKNQYVLSDSGNMKLSEGNKTLTISAVDRSDTGNYTCKAESPIINKESDLFQLIIYYGPDEPQILMNPKTRIFSYGSNVTLTCSVDSFPTSEFRWYLNGVSLSQSKNQLIISNVRQNNTGNYTCETYNKETNLSKQKTIPIFLSEIDDLEDYKNKSWIAAIVVIGLLIFIAVCACIIFRNRSSSI
ncbi:carcinoembryonic antigen-related cell adhesion molecule 5-like isoform X2 [Heterodontus francisci]|uniref:carcinoembryonic antigen-related cell adhesion molecule 5-like isoform X2 n=1 Tax=Heterodontus francisci TaxID=7792 RepID=UPI00355ADC00